jgi:hypothetical protein
MAIPKWKDHEALNFSDQRILELRGLVLHCIRRLAYGFASWRLSMILRGMHHGAIDAQMKQGLCPSVNDVTWLF